MAWLKNGLILFICVSCSFLSFSQNNNIAFRRITTSNGLSSNIVSRIIEDDNGFIWVGTLFGLNRYDGVTIKQYYKQNNVSKSLSDDDIKSLAKDNFNTIWIATAQGLCYTNSSYGDTIYRMPYIGKDSIDFKKSQVYVDKQNNLWFVNGHYLVGCEINAIGKLTLKKRIEIPQLKVNHVLFINEDKRGNIWMSVDQNLYILKAGKLEKVLINNGSILNKGNSDFSYKAFHSLNDSTIWLGLSNKGGLIRYNPLNKSTKYYSISNEINREYANSSVFSIAQNSNTNELLLATQETGLVVFNTVTNKTKIYTNETRDPFSISCSSAWSLFNDSHNNIWVATDDGLNLITKNGQLFKNHYISIFENKSIDNAVTFVLPYKLRNIENYLIGTFGKGLLTYNSSENKYEQLFDIEKNTDNANSFRDAVFDNENSYKVWIASYKGLLLLDLETKKMIQISLSDKKGEQFLPCVRLYAINNFIIVSTLHNGIFVYNKKNKECVNYIDPDKDEYYITVLFEGKKNEIFVRHAAHTIQKINLETHEAVNIDLNKSSFPLKGEIKDFLKKNDNEAWISTNDGLWGLNLSTFECRKVNLNKDFRLNYLSNLIQDNGKNLWAVSKAGILYLNKNEKEYKLFGGEFNINAIPVIALFKKDNNGIIYHGDIGMFYYFNPAEFGKMSNNAKIKISAISVGDSNIALKYIHTKTEPLVLKHFDNNIKFTFSAFNFEQSYYNTYFYQLKGLSTKWVNCGNNVNAFFTNLSPGNYQFNVKVKDVFGNFSPFIGSVNFVITPPFYKAWWFYLMEAIISILLIYFIYKIRINRLLEVERLRTKIATDLHDDIGSTLSSISIISDLTKTKLGNANKDIGELLQIISNNSKESVESMSDIIWSIKPNNDSVGQLINRLKQFSSNIFDAKSIDFSFEYSSEVELVKLNMEKRKTFYLVIKEAINNIAKHSEATEASILLVIVNKSIKVMISDNGKGLSDSSSEGNGLLNIQLRIKQLNGEVLITSNSGHGTEIEFSIPIG